MQSREERNEKARAILEYNRKKLYNNLELDTKEIDKLFKIFKNALNKLYIYKRPNVEQKQLYKLQNDNWIFTFK